ncbi:unnamed protein product [Victoria cruziana]
MLCPQSMATVPRCTDRGRTLQTKQIRSVSPRTQNASHGVILSPYFDVRFFTYLNDGRELNGNGFVMKFLLSRLNFEFHMFKNIATREKTPIG